MSLIILNNVGSSKIATKEFDVVKLNGKYYLELDEFENSASIIELSIALASENLALKERIQLLNEQIKDLQEKS